MNIKRLVALGTAGVLTMGVLAACDDDEDDDNNDNPGVTTTMSGGTVTSDVSGDVPLDTGGTTP